MLFGIFFLYISIFVVHVFQSSYFNVIHIYFLILFKVNFEMCNDATYLGFYLSVCPFRHFLSIDIGLDTRVTFLKVICMLLL